jgi:hypothetical protein
MRYMVVWIQNHDKFIVLKYIENIHIIEFISYKYNTQREQTCDFAGHTNLFLSHVISEMKNKIFMNSNKPHQWCKCHHVIDPVFEPDRIRIISLTLLT